MYKIEQLTASDEKELLCFLNEVFGYNDENGFAVQLPVMWRSEDVVIGKNYAIKDKGKIVASMGIYPLKVHINDKELFIATAGNVGVSKEYRGEGLMKQLYKFAMDKFEELGVDASRLGGERQRYNRYDYEFVGKTYTYYLNKKNVMCGYAGKGGNFETDVSFKKLSREDKEELDFLSALQKKSIWYVERGNYQDFYDIMSAWQSQPYIAYDNSGMPIGGLSVSLDNRNISEFFGITPQIRYEIVRAWLIRSGVEYIVFSSAWFDYEFNRIASGISCSIQVEFSTQCKVCNFEKLANAMLTLKERDEDLNGKSFVLGINAYGNIEISNEKVEKTDKKADFEVDKITATRLLFGYQEPENVCALPKEKQDVIKKLLPMPMWWSNQDRV